MPANWQQVQGVLSSRNGITPSPLKAYAAKEDGNLSLLGKTVNPEVYIHVDQSLVNDINKKLDEFLKNSASSNLDDEITEVKRLSDKLSIHRSSSTTGLKKNELFIGHFDDKDVMDIEEFHQFVRHVGLFLMLHNGKFSPAARKELLEKKKKIHDKFERGLTPIGGAPIPKWQCVSRFSTFPSSNAANRGECKCDHRNADSGDPVQRCGGATCEPEHEKCMHCIAV